MDDLAGKVSVGVCKVKKALLPKFYNKLQSQTGHECMRTYGRLIAIGFYMSQLLHAVLFYTVFGQALQNQFVNYPYIGHVAQALGWFLCFKVTYLYYRVNSTSPGVPSKVLRQTESKAKNTNNAKLPIDQDVAKRYSPDMAEILRYGSIAGQDFETFENAMGQLDEREGVFCNRCKFVKPLRTHHCSVCDQCVLIMDHHCMWTNNCIGLNNYKQFI